MTRIAFGVAEAVGTAKRTFDEITVFAEHGVERGIARDGVAERLHGLDIFFTITCKGLII